MIEIDRHWNRSCSPCQITIKAKGWSSQLEQSGKISLEVHLWQRQSFSGFFGAKQANLSAIVDTGSRYSVISSALFKKIGFSLPNIPQRSLGLLGVVRKSQTEIGPDEYICGWPDISIHVAPFTYFQDIGLPNCSLLIMVAENVPQDKFLLGNDFLRRHSVILTDNQFIMVSAKL